MLSVHAIHWHLNIPKPWYNNKVRHCCVTILCTESEIHSCKSCIANIIATKAGYLQLSISVDPTVLSAAEDHIIKACYRGSIDNQMMLYFIQHSAISVTGVTHYVQGPTWGVIVGTLHNSQYCAILRSWINAICEIIYCIEESQNRQRGVGFPYRAISSSHLTCVRIASERDLANIKNPINLQTCHECTRKRYAVSMQGCQNAYIHTKDKQRPTRAFLEVHK